MASRGSLSLGMGITVGLCGVAAAGFFVTTLVFYGQMQESKRKLEQYQVDTKELVKDTERNSEAVRLMIEEAKKAQGKSLVGYMQEGLSNLSEKISGARGDTIGTLTGKVSRALGEAGGNLLTVLSERDAKVASLEREKADADNARKQALAQLQEASDRIKRLQESQQTTVAALNTDVGTYRRNAEDYGQAVDKARADIQAQITKIKDEAEKEKVEINNQLTKSRDELLVAQAKIRELQRGRSRDSVRPTDEFALVDGSVIDLDNVDDRLVVISRGKADKLVIGMTFEVYGDAQLIKPDSRTGEYPRGKATVEVTKLDEKTAFARIVRNPRGNPVAKGDVIANPVYDPSKQYTFLVFGNFDPDRTGRSTEDGQGIVRAMIEGWGGKLSDQLSGDTDFLILGARPTLPPRPPADAPAPVVQEFIRAQRQVREYDRLVEQAAATSIPILNENRLNTLLGK